MCMHRKWIFSFKFLFCFKSFRELHGKVCDSFIRWLKKKRSKTVKKISIFYSSVWDIWETVHFLVRVLWLASFVGSGQCLCPSVRMSRHLEAIFSSWTRNISLSLILMECHPESFHQILYRWSPTRRHWRRGVRFSRHRCLRCDRFCHSFCHAG